ncbi:MAG: radical SAM protein [Planctomycetes bacterium]|nr:radical SAM protein [Planctomycetota bacterium]
MAYVVEDGRILTRSLEVHVTDHCNLRCRECCTLSPFLPPRFVDPDGLRDDLALAARALRPEFLKLSGGEPLLHPRIVDCIGIAKASGLARTVSVTTNGLLLHEMPEAFWEGLDHLTLSLYPSARLAEVRLAEAEEKAVRHGVELRIKRQDEFERMTLEAPREDEGMTHQIYEECWMKRRCHMLRGGVFYVCTRPPSFDTYFGHGERFAATDGVRLHAGPGLMRELLWYLGRGEPLAACRHCWGGQGTKFAHEQAPPGTGRRSRPWPPQAPMSSACATGESC